MIFDIYVGDWSNDGHGQANRYLLDTSDYTSGEAILADFNRGLEILGIDSIDQYARNYEQNEFPLDLLEKLGLLEDIDYDIEWLLEEEETHTGLSPDEYLMLWATVVRVANPEFTYQLIKGDARLNIGGYGLYVP